MLEGLSVLTHGEAETRALARALAADLAQGDLILLFGAMGAGKTTFVGGLVEGLEHQDPREVASPTFALLHRYGGGRLPVDHLDLYRIEDGSRIAEQGLLDGLAAGEGVTVIEWPERLPAPLPKALVIRLSHVDEERRRISFEGQHWGLRFRALAAQSE